MNKSVREMAIEVLISSQKELKVSEIANEISIKFPEYYKEKLTKFSTRQKTIQRISVLINSACQLRYKPGELNGVQYVLIHCGENPARWKAAKGDEYEQGYYDGCEHCGCNCCC
jgi:hypothetical protein